VKIQGKRVSKNIREQTPQNKTLADTEERSRRQIFDPIFSGKLTKVSNRMANADRLMNKGPGAKAMKAPASKAPVTKFLPFVEVKTASGKKGKVLKNG
jgi:hypothetical protein